MCVSILNNVPKFKTFHNFLNNNIVFKHFYEIYQQISLLPNEEKTNTYVIIINNC